MTDTATKLSLAYELSPILGKALAHLYNRPIVTRDEFKKKLAEFSNYDDVSVSNVHIVIHRLRGRLKDYGIEIRMRRGIGIMITDVGRGLIDDAIYEYDLYYGSKDNADKSRIDPTDENIRAINA